MRFSIKHSLALLITLIALVLAQSASASLKLVTGEVTKVSDGDTIGFLQTATKTSPDALKVRMIGIDTPELHLIVDGKCCFGQGEFGQKAYEVLKQITPVGSAVALQSYGIDGYGRTLGRVYDGKSDVNLQMVKSGWAYPYIICEGEKCNEKFFKDQNVEAYLKACKQARNKGLGNFNPKNPLKELPFEFRLRMQKRAPNKYIGSYKTKELFEPTEYKKVDICDSIFFLTKEDANRAGFR